MNEGAFGFSELLKAKGRVDWYLRSVGMIACVAVANVVDLDVNVCRNKCNGWYYGKLDNWLKEDVKEEMVGVPDVEVCPELDAGFFLRAEATYIYIDRIRKSCRKDRWRQRIEDNDVANV